jgi:hypothetical protein
MIVLDTGALVALERGDQQMWVRVAHAVASDVPVVVPTGALAQGWRGGGPRQARLARALADCETASFDRQARAAGELCGRTGTQDVVDASVALVAADPTARALYTSDPGDLRHLLDALGPHRPAIIPI